MERIPTQRHIILEAEEEGGYHVYCPSLPGCHSQGETIEEAVENIKEAIDLYIEDMVEAGEIVPEDTLRALMIVTV